MKSLSEAAVAPERGKSRGGTRGGKPNQASSDVGLSGFTPLAPNLDAEMDKCDGSEAMTQQLLGELIQRPKLTEKLLGKPPFRFLHDIVMEVIRSTGFAKGLYNEVESDSANVTEKEQKIIFLEKIIKVVGVQLNTLVEAKPLKIVAGLEAQSTNNFLQLLAVAAKHMPDSTKAVRTVLEQMGGSAPSSDQPLQQEAPQRKPEREELAPAEEKRPSRQQPPPQAIAPPPQDSFPADSKDSSRQQQPPIQSSDDRRDFITDDKVCSRCNSNE